MNATSVERIWDFWSQIHVARYDLADANGTVHPHIRYETDLRSTQSHLHTADDLGLRKVGFWTWRGHNDASAQPLFDATFAWATATAAAAEETK